MTRMSGWAFWAVLLPVMGTVGFAQVRSKNVYDSGVPSVQATKDPKDMSRAELTTTVKRLDADLFGAYNDNDEGDAKFVQLWKYEGGRWWLTVVISYDHNEPLNGKR